VDKVRDVFSPKPNSVLFSTVHKAKGLEADDVTIIRPDLMPPPWIQRSNQPEKLLRDENNIRYVAITRARLRLTYQYDGDKA
jgi:superfamily I DNA/RNA helicase